MTLAHAPSPAACARPERLHRYETAVADSARWDAYHPREGDIIVATAPKCGTTWTQMLCALLAHGPVLPAPLTRLSPWLDRLSTPIEALIAELDAQTGRRIIKTHTPLDGLPYFEEVSYVFCGRDPRDAFLSTMDNMRNTSAATMAAVRARLCLPDSFAFPTDANAFFPVWMTVPIHAWVEDGFPIGSVFGTARAFWRWRELPNLHFTHYRDLTGDLEGELRRLAGFLRIGVAPAAWRRLLDAASFAAMRACADHTAPGAHLGEWTSNRDFFVRARLGEWREALSGANQALYEELAPQRVSPPLRAWLESGRAAAGDPRLI
jgi:aryl sulfotransferase